MAHSNNNLLLSLCRNDQEDELETFFEEKECEVNYQDGAGNTAAHYAAKAGSIGCLEILVNIEGVDIDIQNTLELDTPLHKAVMHQDEDAEVAFSMAELLLMAGAKQNIQNRNKLTPKQVVNSNGIAMKSLFMEYEAGNGMYADDIVSLDGEEEGSEGESSGEEA
ncbi:ankyrin repeat-containing domain protein [Spinellus fusiger]|nr:ankyrin repeat-containing domain protein [Spinellus fusiger]